MNNFQTIKDWYESLSPKSLKSISEYYDQDAFFKDPFNELNGCNQIKKIFDHMFDNLEHPKFTFTDEVIKQEAALLIWDFTFIVKQKEFKIHGSTHLKLNKEGKIIYHRDYWDVGEEVLAKIPLISTVYKKLTAKLRA